ncbi:uncharacterized protein KQ657_000592 [Scheffersomyces spartinae]|uniref:Dolichyl-phosphate-mannose--protein mannosyltransferase n=1 Tax=Scheffersomyces spartinae TaxID=45513 RepID=A0A9P7V968_9ASCO|nr:uncharacterized protein KQ657_000592 [Scheffersomyces spartinae]KAG7193524.1 hypothetical protein KQ657_000592 [Scheffersomyces spartinae]
MVHSIHTSQVRARHTPTDQPDIEDIIKKTSQLKIVDKKKYDWKHIVTSIVLPLMLTAVSAFIRLYKIEANPKVVWDEAHFGKFGSHYIQHSFYFDVHPPLGKLLVALLGYLCGYNGDFDFGSGQTYPDEVNYVMMRCFNCLFGILCTPLAYKTAVQSGFLTWSVMLITLLVVFEMLSLTLSKFILLDSMLLFFTVLTYYCLVNYHRLRLEDKLLKWEGIKWLLLTGFSVGCVCSVKWVGVFVTAIVGFYTIYDLVLKFYQLSSLKVGKKKYKTRELTKTAYLLHWLLRVFALIVIPIVIYMTSFFIHFTILSKTGPGDGSISTLLQANLEGNTLKHGPRDVSFGSSITLRSQGLSPNLLHSHHHNYPEGSLQQQITTYGHKDENNEFQVEFEWSKGILDTKNMSVRNGDTIRLLHSQTGCLLHSHLIPAIILSSHYEVSCYANLDNSDSKDDWIIEFQEQLESPDPDFNSEDPNVLHPISTSFRLKHKVLGCYLATTGLAYPSWGFQQGEVICKRALLTKDKSTWWNIEDHVNTQMDLPLKNFVAPKPRFWKEFIMINYAMMASNNALVPDPDKFDRLSSQWWQWPILELGLRMCSWASDDIRYFLMGNPFVTWVSTATLAIFLVLVVPIKLILWRRQVVEFDIMGAQVNKFLIGGLIPFIAWFCHYWPFIQMARVTYLHHYVPALYFAIIVMAYVMETMFYEPFKQTKYSVVYVVMYLMAYVGVIGTFWYFKDFALGMTGPTRNYHHLRLLKSWAV